MPTSDGRRDILILQHCPECKALEDDPPTDPCGCSRGGKLEPRVYLAVDALLSDEAVGRAIVAASTHTGDDGHTDCYYRSIIAAAAGVPCTPCTTEVSEVSHPNEVPEPRGTCVIHGDYWTDDCRWCGMGAR